jgi:hypothetical protein
MKRNILWSLAALAMFGSNAAADVYVQVPFVRFRYGGPGWYVRAPFVSVYGPGVSFYGPSIPRYYIMPGSDLSPPTYIPPLQQQLLPQQPQFQQQEQPQQQPQQPQAEAIPNAPKKTPAFAPPAPNPKADDTLPNAPKKTPAFPPPPKLDDAPPAPAPGGQERVMTLEQFSKAFQPKAGNYEVTLLSPVTNQATTVRFSLPEGTPRRVHVSGNQLEFDYGPRQYVRIRFDRDGAEVISR